MTDPTRVAVVVSILGSYHVRLSSDSQYSQNVGIYRLRNRDTRIGGSN